MVTETSIPQEAKEIVEAIENQVISARTITITTVEQYQWSGDELKAIKARVKEIDDLEKSLTRPINESLKRLRDFFRPAKDNLARIEQLYRQARLIYQQAEERKRQEKEAELRRIAEAEQRRRDAVAERQAEKARARGDEAKAQEILDRVPVIPVPVIASEVPKTEGIALRKNWKFRIVDEAALPREYLIPNEKMLAAFAQATKGTIPVPGVEFYFEQVEAVRT